MFKIEQALADDCPDIKVLEEQSGLSSWSLPDYKEETSRRDSLFFVARENDSVIGFLLARLIPATDDDRDDEIEIYNIAVSPQHRRRQIATSLIAKLPVEAFVTLEVRSQNQSAIAFYERLGFGITGRRRAFYSNPTDDALIMRCRRRLP